MFYYQRQPKNDSEVINKLTALVEQYPRYGFDKLFPLIRREGHPWNHKRVHRVYREMKLNLRRKKKSRLKRIPPKPLLQPIRPNYCWSMDFMQDSLSSGRVFRNAPPHDSPEADRSGCARPGASGPAPARRSESSHGRPPKPALRVRGPAISDESVPCGRWIGSVVPARRAAARTRRKPDPRARCMSTLRAATGSR